ncbi:uncharacterized protein [Nicotiana tomentosiformis]|uniref:uncharacterized protein n=1 Tax=Nicotiana tomentosiformis TaxID=4098 RepID=UPI00388CAECD
MGVLPAQQVAATGAEVGPPMSDEEQKRLERFGRLKPPEFSGEELENAQDFLDRCQQILRTAGISETSGVAFTTFQLTGEAYRWWQFYELSGLVRARSLSWHEFSILFFEKFVPQTRMEELRRDFEQLRQGDMTMTQYEMRFIYLACHDIWLVPTKRGWIRRFIDGLNYGPRYSLAREAETDVRFDQVVEISRRLEFVRRLEHEEREGKRTRSFGGFSGTSSVAQSHHSRGRPYWPAQMARPVYRAALASHGSYSARPHQSSFSALLEQSSSCALSVQGLSVPGSSSGYSSSQGPMQAPPPFPARGCYVCEELEHMRKYCPRGYRGPVQ